MALCLCWQVEDVVAVSLGRVLLLTDGHIIMLRSSRTAGSRDADSSGGGGGEEEEPDYRHKWRVRTTEVQQIKGALLCHYRCNFQLCIWTQCTCSLAIRWQLVASQHDN